MPSNTLSFIIEQCDFAISTFRWDMLSITEGSPLKSRQYLCHGCPILVNYYDCAHDFKDLQPFVFDYRIDKEQSIANISSNSYKKQSLANLACDLLSWEHYFNTVLN